MQVAPGMPVMQQPRHQVWNFMSAPSRPENCPPGLEYLMQLDEIIVRQEVEMFEILLNIDTANRYRVCNKSGQQIWYSAEEANMICQTCCGPRRSFVIIVTDQTGATIMRIVRDFKCCAVCPLCARCDCCRHTLTVEAPPGVPIGYVQQQASCCLPHFEILNEKKNPVFFISGPLCMCECINLNFKLYSFSNPNVVVGTISKKIESLLMEMFTNADTFAVSFPVDLDVKLKATIFGAVFLIDFMYFEHKVQDKRESNRDGADN